MKPKPMLMSTPMVQATLEGIKTQTRRVIKFPNNETDGDIPDRSYIDASMSKALKPCEYCREAWKPLFRITEQYEYGEPITRYCECEECEHNQEEHPECETCETAPFWNQNTLNLSIYVLGGMGELVFEDKEQQCQKYRKLISFCPMCGRDLRK